MKKQIRKVLPLREEPFFRSLSDAAVSSVEAFVHHREYEPRQIVYFPDDACDYVYWVRQGRVKVTRVSGEGRELAFRHLFPGDMLGEECLVEKPKREAYAEALTQTILCMMPAREFRRVMNQVGEFAQLVAKQLCKRVNEVEQVLAETVFKSVRSRVASGLFRLYQRAPESDRTALRITHQEIASLVGSTRETTTVVLHELRQDGVLNIANRRVVVVDPVALEHIARSG